MKKILFSILCAFMASTMASAQYLNVKLDDGTYHSYKTTPNMEVSFGEKKGTEVAESEQTVTVNGHKVTVKLADDTPASEVALHTYIEGDKVKIKAMCWDSYGLECIKNGEAITPDVSNGFHTFTLSDISKDMVVTVGYITVSFDLNNSNITDNFKNTEDIRIGYNSTIPRTYASAEKHSFRGWYKDKECTSPWNYSGDKVTKSITLYAKWAEDPTGTQINGHDFVKLGGYYWATENVSSNDFYRVYHDGTYGDYFNQCDGSTREFNSINNNALNAAKSFGGTWTLPSEAQWQALIDYCDWEWKTDYEYNGTTMNGMLVKGRSDTYESGHSIFLPAAGIYYDGGSLVGGQGGRGYYWSTDDERYLLFYNGGRDLINYRPINGMAVRPVSE